MAATFDGAVHDNVADASPAMAVTAVGATGGKNGVAATGEIDGPVPAAFTAATRNAYVVPFVRPIAEYVRPVSVDVNVVHVAPPSSLRCTTYAVTELPPFELGAVQARSTLLPPAVAVRVAGASGVVNGVPVAVALTVPVPATLIALTRNEYVVALVKPVTVYDTAWLPVEVVTTVHVVPLVLDSTL